MADISSTTRVKTYRHNAKHAFKVCLGLTTVLLGPSYMGMVFAISSKALHIKEWAVSISSRRDKPP